MRFAHDMHLSAGGFFDGFMKFVTVFGDGGIILILLSIGLIAFKKTRKIGLTMLGALAIGALISNIILKPLVARPRPYANEDEIFYTWWKLVGAVKESEFSFPSGHATASMAAMMGFFLAGNKKYSWTGFFAALLIGFSRIYLCVHYPSDVLFGFLVGIVAAIISYIIVRLAYKYLNGTKVGNFLNEKDAITLYKYVKAKYFDKNQKVVAEGDISEVESDLQTDFDGQIETEEQNTSCNRCANFEDAEQDISAQSDCNIQDNEVDKTSYNYFSDENIDDKTN